ncbi:MAG: hypothetical protein ABI723_10660 [Bacteroidia bacterium]
MTQINELVIRVPGMDAEESNSFGKDVARQVAEALPEGMGNQHIPELKIKMTASQLNSSSAMASSVASQIILQLKLATL